MTPLAIHAYAIVRPGTSTPVWRSDAWLLRRNDGGHLLLLPANDGAQLSLFGAAS